MFADEPLLNAALHQPLHTYPRDALERELRLALDVHVLRGFARFLLDRAEELFTRNEELEQCERNDSIRQVGLTGALAKLGTDLEVTQAQYERWKAAEWGVDMRHVNAHTIRYRLVRPRATKKG